MKYVKNTDKYRNIEQKVCVIQKKSLTLSAI